MSTSLGLGRLKPPNFAGLVPWNAQYGLNEDARALAADFYWGGYPPPPVQIPVGWIRAPIRIRQDTPLNVAEVTQLLGNTARSRDQVSVAANGGREWKFTETIDSIVAVDPANLAAWVTAYYADPRPRHAVLTLILNGRAETEIWRILGVTAGRRVAITAAPSDWPTGGVALVVEGVRHLITADLRTVEWLASPVVGAAAGTAGPWFRTDQSRTSDAGGTDPVPF